VLVDAAPPRPTSTPSTRPLTPSPHTRPQARQFRRAAQENAAADARTLFRREAEWMAKQPKARQAKSQARISKFYELSSR
jgi:ATP-binding cassette subfamily F protein uup